MPDTLATLREVRVCDTHRACSAVARVEALGWMRRDPKGRAIRVTPSGKASFAEALPVGFALHPRIL